MFVDYSRCCTCLIQAPHDVPLVSYRARKNPAYLERRFLFSSSKRDPYSDYYWLSLPGGIGRSTTPWNEREQ